MKKIKSIFIGWGKGTAGYHVGMEMHLGDKPVKISRIEEDVKKVGFSVDPAGARTENYIKTYRCISETGGDLAEIEQGQGITVYYYSY